MNTGAKFFSFLNKAILWIEGVLWEFIKQHWKLILLVVAGIVIFSQVKSCKEQNNIINSLKTVITYNDSSYSSDIFTWEDKYGKEHSRIENLVIDKKALEGQVEDLTGLVNVKVKQIQALSQTRSKLNLSEKLRVDTISSILPSSSSDTIRIPQILAFTFADAHIQISGTLGGGIDSIHVNGYDTINRTDYWKRKWFLGRKRYYSDFTNSNPYIKTEGYKGVVTRAPAKRWGIGFNIQAGYPFGVPINLKRPVIQAGVGIQYNVIVW